MRDMPRQVNGRRYRGDQGRVLINAQEGPLAGQSKRGSQRQCLQRRAVERRLGFCFGLVFPVYRGAVVRDGDVTTEVATGGRRTKSCRLLPPGADRS
jgi:hypothetical protein